MEDSIGFVSPLSHPESTKELIGLGKIWPSGEGDVRRPVDARTTAIAARQSVSDRAGTSSLRKAKTGRIASMDLTGAAGPTL
ncbi:TPR domain protein [Aspergillus luchuensis]|uniref:TPR domain protein n=1 Tax=Aspergillus kawachii TaxID=1069201 RepID=A0A146FVX5_ASPKA|nr:TPR domain protein [Aspergillus luchuensis]